MTKAQHGWNDQRVERLRDLHAKCCTASQMARDLGVSRNAVIGKLHRIGLFAHPNAKNRGGRSGGRKTSKSRPAFQKPISPVRAMFQAEPYVPPAEELVIPFNERKTILTLNDADCRWPIGEPGHPDFHFCGKKQIPSLPYCEVHARRAYQPPNPRPRSPSQVPALPEKVMEVV